MSLKLYAVAKDHTCHLVAAENEDEAEDLALDDPEVADSVREISHDDAAKMKVRVPLLQIFQETQEPGVLATTEE